MAHSIEASEPVEALEGSRESSGEAARGLLATLLAAVAFIGTGVGLSLSLVTLGAPPQLRQEPIGALATFGFVVTLGVVGLVLRRHPAGRPIGMVLLAFAASGGVSHALWGGLMLQRLPGGDPALGQVLAWLNGTFTPATWTYLMAALIVRFPTGRTETAFDARILRASALACAVLAVLLAVRPGPFLVVPTYENPLLIPDVLRGPVTVASNVAIAVALVPGALGVWRMVERYRHASLVGRLQLRWFAFAAVLTLVGAVLFVGIGALLAPTNLLLRDMTYTALVLCAVSLPIAVLQAITRHRLYEIDRIIERTFIYGVLTAILAGVYTASVRLFNAIFVGLTGQEDEAALVLTTLVLATTFTPIKARLEKIAEKRLKVAEPASDASAVESAAHAHSHTHAEGGDAAFTPEQLEQLDARIEAVARRVVAEALEDSRRRRSR